MNRKPLEKLETLLRKTIDDLCNMEEKRKGNDYLILLSRFLTSYSDECIRLTKDYTFDDVLLQSENEYPYFKIPKYQWHDQIVSEIKIPARSNDIPIVKCSSKGFSFPKPISLKVAIYKPTGMKEFDCYQYEFDRMEER